MNFKSSVHLAFLGCSLYLTSLFCVFWFFLTSLMSLSSLVTKRRGPMKYLPYQMTSSLQYNALTTFTTSQDDIVDSVKISKNTYIWGLNSI